MGAGTGGTDDQDGTAFVFAPSPLLTVTVEADGDGGPEIHLHAGGQGHWIARMLVTLGVRTTLAAPFGGETGSVLRHLIADEGIAVRATDQLLPNGAYVHDRRGGERAEVAQMAPPALSRHEVDELYTASLAAGLDADVAVLGGAHAPHTVPADTFRRLVADLRAVEVPVVADLSGDALTAAVAGGLTVLKVSQEDLVGDGRAESDEPKVLVAAMRALAEEGAEAVVLSRAGDPALALVDDEVLAVHAPTLQLEDHRGAGDSMTAGIAAALARGGDLRRALCLGAAAGALNVTRRGLATGHRDVAARLAERVVVEPFREG
ncbi:PfkB family carbohydrate kinase [Geodermatophilus sp. SYSU D00758]